MQQLDLSDEMKKKLRIKAGKEQLTVPEYITKIIEQDLDDGFLEDFEEVYGFLYDEDANESVG